MSQHTSANNIIVYVSEECPICDRVVSQLKKWEVSFDVKNVTKNKEAMSEMQRQGLYGTPVTVHKRFKKQVLGFNKVDLRRFVKSERADSRENTATFLLNQSN